MISILFICHGNICRSPMAEFVMKKLAADAGLANAFHIASAATTDEEIENSAGNPVYPPVRKLLAAEGIDVSGKRARLLTAADYDRFDYLIGMDEENRRDMLRLFHGDPDRKCSLLMDYTEKPGPVADPWYTRDFRGTWRDVCEGCGGLFSFLLGKERNHS